MIDRKYISLFNYITSDSNNKAASPLAIKELWTYDVFDFYYLMESQEKKLKQSKK